jgi:hypothetical protein
MGPTRFIQHQIFTVQKAFTAAHDLFIVVIEALGVWFRENLVNGFPKYFRAIFSSE